MSHVILFYLTWNHSTALGFFCVLEWANKYKSHWVKIVSRGHQTGVFSWATQDAFTGNSLSRACALLDALFCCTCFHREHSDIWSAAIVLGTCTLMFINGFPTKHLLFDWAWIVDIISGLCFSSISKKWEKSTSILEGLCDSANRQVLKIVLSFTVYYEGILIINTLIMLE